MISVTTTAFIVCQHGRAAAPWGDEVTSEDGFFWRIGKRRALALFDVRRPHHFWLFRRPRGLRRVTERSRLVSVSPVPRDARR